MIYGIGIDLIAINRIQDIYNKFGDAFLKKVFTPEEINRFIIDNDINFLAKRFAAKEAFVKALGTGITTEVFFNCIGVHNDNQNKPIIHCNEKVIKILKDKKITNIHVSLSDEKNYAIAMVLLEVSL